MRVDSLTLDHFRNYTRTEVSFDSRMNVICGENAQGKTNLLEAIAYLSTASSHRAHSDKELIAFGEDHSFLTGKIFSRQREFTLEAGLHRHARRQLKRNGVKLRRVSELGEVLNTVLFCPEDLLLIRSGAAERRRFLDDTISQLRPRYGEALAGYKKALEAKNFILRNQEQRPDLLATLDDFSYQLCRYGGAIVRYRAYFVQKLEAWAPEIHQEFSGGKEVLSLSYATEPGVEALGTEAEITAALLSRYESHRSAELAAKKCLTGPHRDDLVVNIDGRSARQFASQGQTRTAALSLKLAQRDMMRDDRGEYPVLLLDDVLSELDARRQEFVLNHIQGGQVFLTCCEEERLGALEGGRVFRVSGGQAVEEV